MQIKTIQEKAECAADCALSTSYNAKTRTITFSHVRGEHEAVFQAGPKLMQEFKDTGIGPLVIEKLKRHHEEWDG